MEEFQGSTVGQLQLTIVDENGLVSVEREQRQDEMLSKFTYVVAYFENPILCQLWKDYFL